MANNRLYFVHKPTNTAIYLGKRMAWGWYDVPDNLSDLFNALFSVVEEAGKDQDAFAVEDEGVDNDYNFLLTQIREPKRCTCPGKPTNKGYKGTECNICGLPR